MPNLYGQMHDQFLENYLNKNEFTFFKEERHLFITRIILFIALNDSIIIQTFHWGDQNLSQHIWFSFR